MQVSSPIFCQAPGLVSISVMRVISFGLFRVTVVRDFIGWPIITPSSIHTVLPSFSPSEAPCQALPMLSKPISTSLLREVSYPHCIVPLAPAGMAAFFSDFQAPVFAKPSTSWARASSSAKARFSARTAGTHGSRRSVLRCSFSQPAAEGGTGSKGSVGVRVGSISGLISPWSPTNTSSPARWPSNTTSASTSRPG